MVWGRWRRFGESFLVTGNKNAECPEILGSADRLGSGHEDSGESSEEKKAEESRNGKGPFKV